MVDDGPKQDVRPLPEPGFATAGPQSPYATVVPRIEPTCPRLPRGLAERCGYR